MAQLFDSMRPVVVITGASSGIGRATALRFARKKAHLVLAARHDEAIEDAAEACRALGARAIAVPTDVSDEQAVEELAHRAVAEYGRIDVWINNAGVYMMGMFDEIPSEAHRRLMEINVFGVIHGAKAALPIFRRQDRGVLINVSSVAGKAGYRLGATYCASKAAVKTLSEALQQEVLGTGVRVVPVFLGSTDTPLFTQAANFTGRKLRPMAPVYTADRIACAIVGAAYRPRREVNVGSMPLMTSLMRALFPGGFARSMAGMVETKHFEDAPALRTAGNLFSPSPEKRVEGGWKSSAPKVIGAVAGVAFGLAALRAAAPRLLRA